MTIEHVAKLAADLRKRIENRRSGMEIDLLLISEAEAVAEALEISVSRERSWSPNPPAELGVYAVRFSSTVELSREEDTPHKLRFVTNLDTDETEELGFFLGDHPDAEWQGPLEEVLGDDEDASELEDQ